MLVFAVKNISIYFILYKMLQIHKSQNPLKSFAKLCQFAKENNGRKMNEKQSTKAKYTYLKK